MISTTFGYAPVLVAKEMGFLNAKVSIPEIVVRSCVAVATAEVFTVAHRDGLQQRASDIYFSGLTWPSLVAYVLSTARPAQCNNLWNEVCT